jgi:hypothetical protein
MHFGRCIKKAQNEMVNDIKNEGRALGGGTALLGVKCVSYGS